MTAPKREQLTNNASSQLNGAINNSVTSITVVSGTPFPSVGNFRLLIEDEILLCTARSGTGLTVLRGQEGTTAASHADGTNVTHILTAGGLYRWSADNTFFNSLAPPLGRIDNGSGGLLTSADFTWNNQGTSTITDQNGTMFLRCPGAGGENCRVLYRTAPSAPYSVIAAVQAWNIREGTCNYGLVFRKASDSKLHAFGNSFDDFGPIRYSLYNFNSSTSFSSTPYGRDDCTHVGEYMWFKIEDNNTNLLFYVSYDGVEWLLVHSLGRTSFMSGGPDQVGFYINNSGSSSKEAGLRVAHWSTF